MCLFLKESCHLLVNEVCVFYDWMDLVYNHLLLSLLSSLLPAHHVGLFMYDRSMLTGTEIRTEQGFDRGHPLFQLPHRPCQKWYRPNAMPHVV